jgi:hypothetical protein
MAGSSLRSFLSDACKTKAVNICSGIAVVRVKAVVWWKTSRDSYHWNTSRKSIRPDSKSDNMAKEKSFLTLMNSKVNRQGHPPVN